MKEGVGLALLGIQRRRKKKKGGGLKRGGDTQCFKKKPAACMSTWPPSRENKGGGQGRKLCDQPARCKAAQKCLLSKLLKRKGWGGGTEGK